MNRNTRLKIVLLGLATILLGALGFERGALTASGSAPVDFRREIEPLLVASCQQCHGAKKAAGQLRLDVKAAALKGGI
ncbi:MAG: c-type cytochrome domain-containing protein, partial [Acidobacteriota bacterium]